MKKKDLKKLSFEEKITLLEEIQSNMEEEISLEENKKNFEMAQELIKLSQKELDEANLEIVKIENNIEKNFKIN